MTALAVLLPEMEPMRPLDSTAILAGPPLKRPASAVANSMVNCPKPDFSRNAPKTMNRKMKFAEMWVGSPNSPSVRKYWLSATSDSE